MDVMSSKSRLYYTNKKKYPPVSRKPRIAAEYQGYIECEDGSAMLSDPFTTVMAVEAWLNWAEVLYMNENRIIIKKGWQMCR